jgi:hypothetical protein
MLEECLAGTGIAQVFGWGFGQLLEREKLVDLFPSWHGEVRSSPSIHRARTRQQKFERLLSGGADPQLAPRYVAPAHPGNMYMYVPRHSSRTHRIGTNNRY